MMQTSSRRFDAIVVGSGITGGWAAKELCEHGLRTLVLGAGRDITPERDYVEHVQPWQVRFRGYAARSSGTSRFSGTATPATSGPRSSSSTTAKIPISTSRTSRFTGSAGATWAAAR